MRSAIVIRSDVHDAHVDARRVWVREWLRERTTVVTTEHGRCLLWNLYMDCNGRPRCSLFGEKGQYTRYIVFDALNGNKRRGREIVASCGDPRCLSHLQAMTQSARQKLQFRQGKFGRPEGVAKRLAKRRAREGYTMATARRARELCAEGLTKRAVAKQLGLSPSAVSRICRGLAWLEAPVRASSVFNLGACA